jgi:hypothetical protein
MFVPEVIAQLHCAFMILRFAKLCPERFVCLFVLLALETNTNNCNSTSPSTYRAVGGMVGSLFTSVSTSSVLEKLGIEDG